MKNQLSYRINIIGWFLLIISIILVITPKRAHAQRASFTPRNLYIGFETTTGSRSFQVNSDLADLRAAKVQQKGQTYGLMIGTRLISGKIKFGSFSSSESDSPVKASTFELGSTINPIQLFTNKPHIIEPYLTTSIESSSIKSSGSYTPLKITPKHSGSGNGSCDSGSMPANPDAADPTPTPVKSEPVPYSGSYGTTRLNLGAGLKIHIAKGNHFINLFGEMKYGIPLGTTSSTQALSYTYALGQSTIDIGATIGFIRNKSKVRRVKFR